eukprot:PITA_20856
MISVSKLDDAGVKIVFKKDTCKMVWGGLVLMRGVWIGTLYKLQGSTFIDGCNSSEVPESGSENLVVSGEKTMLWHQKLGHIGEKGLQILHGKGMVEGMTNSSLDFYFFENCVYGKQNREPEKIEFEPKEEESNSTTEEESKDEEPQTLVVRRSVQERRQPERYIPSSFYSNFALSITDDDPRTVKEAIDSKDGKLWKEAMVNEMASLHKNEAWDLVEFLTRRKPIGNKLTFKKKTNAEGKVEK